MRSKRFWFSAIAWVALLAWSVEIVLHRWVWRQIPTQVGAGWVYALLVVNLGLLVVLRPSVVASEAKQSRLS